MVKPAVDAEGRTKPDAAHTAIVGSSLGGLVSVWAGLARALSATGKTDEDRQLVLVALRRARELAPGDAKYRAELAMRLPRPKMGEKVAAAAAERMTFFSDAVVAIAMTLLVLPLLVFLLAMNLLAIYLRRRFERRW